MAVPPIKYALMSSETQLVEPDRFDTEAQAQKALEDRDDGDSFVIAQVRDQVPPDVS